MPEFVPRVAIGSFFSIWLVATVLSQFESRLRQRVAQLDIFHLLPRWTFFAPNPGTWDHHLLFRTMNREGGVSEFSEISLHSRPLTAFAWNPGKRVKKGLLDLASQLDQLCGSGSLDDRNIRLSFHYVALLNMVLTQFEHTDNTQSVQFALMKTRGFAEDDAQLILCSDFHEVMA